jgi:nucleotide-binding universal stress UspA family protein
MKILLAIDSSPASQLVATTAATRPWPLGTLFCVMTVVDIDRWEGLPALLEDAKHEAQSLAKRAADTLTQSGHEVFSEIQLGLPKKAIPDYATQWGADLVIVGSHGQSALTRFFLGSVAQAVLRTSPCSVEIVRPGPIFPRASHGIKILLATDGSECSAKAVYSVANRPWGRITGWHTITVVDCKDCAAESRFRWLLLAIVERPQPNSEHEGRPIRPRFPLAGDPIRVGHGSQEQSNPLPTLLPYQG